MSGAQLDGPGMAKMQTLEDALTHLQRVHGIVEQMAMAVKLQKPSLSFGLQLRRVGTPLVGLLKGQFGVISDQIMAMLLIATRGGSEQMKVRALRESVAQVRMALEVMVAKVREQHTVEGEKGTS
jgi:hypothetical protein